MQLNLFFLTDAVLAMLEGKTYRTADMLCPIVCGFTDRMAGYTRSSNMTTVHAVFSALKSKAVSCNWKQGWTCEGVKVIGTEVCELKNEVLELFCFVCTSQVHTMTLYLVVYVSSFGDV